MGISNLAILCTVIGTAVAVIASLAGLIAYYERRGFGNGQIAQKLDNLQRSFDPLPIDELRKEIGGERMERNRHYEELRRHGAVLEATLSNIDKALERLPSSDRVRQLEEERKETVRRLSEERAELLRHIEDERRDRKAGETELFNRLVSMMQTMLAVQMPAAQQGGKP